MLPRTDPLEAVEDQVEPERERALVVRVARLEVLLDVLDEVRQLARGKLPEEGRRHGRRMSSSVPRSIPTCHSVNPDDVAVQRVIRVIGHLGREARLAEASEDRLHVSQPSRR